VSAVLSAVLALLWVLGAGSVAAVYLGHMARSAARAGRRPGDALATVGILVGWLGVVVALVVIGLAVAPG
jgi:hypothetical protein